MRFLSWPLGLVSGAVVKNTGSWWDVAFTLAIYCAMVWFASRLVANRTR